MSATPGQVDVAVALTWDGVGVPRVTAKGRGEVAERIAALARAHDVPISDDPELVEVLAQVDLGTAIPEALFVAVAEVIAFAYSVSERMPESLRERVGVVTPPASDGTAG
ncbi:MAG: EscU/YscU/HrcU family type III secretion system export apparatus switch protein [Gammaproteobacteria bacterium]